MILVIRIVATRPHAIDQNREIPILRSTVRTSRNTTTPTPHAT
jgi:hypothetical protein